MDFKDYIIFLEVSKLNKILLKLINIINVKYGLIVIAIKIISKLYHSNNKEKLSNKYSILYKINVLSLKYQNNFLINCHQLNIFYKLWNLLILLHNKIQ